MKATNSLLGGLAGALVLTTLHEVIRRKTANAPRMDKLGEQALNKSLKAAGSKPLRGNKLYYTTLVGDVFGNALYYSLIGTGNKGGGIGRGLALGLAAGIGGVELPGPLGLDKKYAARTKKTSVLTIGYYVIGSLIATAGYESVREAKG